MHWVVVRKSLADKRGHHKARLCLGNGNHYMRPRVIFLLLCRLDTLRKGMQDSADRIRKLEREYQVGRLAAASVGHRAVPTCHLCCN